MTKNAFSLNGGKHNVPVKDFTQTAKDFIKMFGMAIPLATLCKNLEMFCPAGTEIWPKMYIYGKVKVTAQGHP